MVYMPYPIPPSWYIPNANQEGTTQCKKVQIKDIWYSKQAINAEIYIYTLNKKLVKVGHMGMKGASSLVNHLVD